MDILGGLAVAATLLSLAMGHRPHLSGPEFPLGLAFLLWSAFSVAASIRWYGGAVMTLYSLSISFFVFLLVILNVTTRRRLGIVVALTCVCLLVVLAQATRPTTRTPRSLPSSSPWRPEAESTPSSIPRMLTSSRMRSLRTA